MWDLPRRGRFCPPHRGHLYQIIEASTKCEKLIVVISDNADQTREICESAGLPTITYQLRKQWISQQIQDMEHILVRVLNETDIPAYPDGWQLWSERMKEIIPEGIDAFFVGDSDYQATLEAYFPKAVVEMFDPTRTRYPISATTFWATGIIFWALRARFLPRRCSSRARKAAAKPR